jgi:hypothetical protein
VLDRVLLNRAYANLRVRPIQRGKQKALDRRSTLLDGGDERFGLQLLRTIFSGRRVGQYHNQQKRRADCRETVHHFESAELFT